MDPHFVATVGNSRRGAYLPVSFPHRFRQYDHFDHNGLWSARTCALLLCLQCSRSSVRIGMGFDMDTDSLLGLGWLLLGCGQDSQSQIGLEKLVWLHLLDCSSYSPWLAFRHGAIQARHNRTCRDFSSLPVFLVVWNDGSECLLDPDSANLDLLHRR